MWMSTLEPCPGEKEGSETDLQNTGAYVSSF